MKFPCHMTFEQLAIQPYAAECFSWDDSEADEDDEPNLAARIDNYTADMRGGKLADYLRTCGYWIDDTGVHVTNETALRLAHALHEQIVFEYDAYPEDLITRVPHTIYGHTNLASPTWAMFDITGDDSVDYQGTQPSCLSALLITLVDLAKGA